MLAANVATVHGGVLGLQYLQPSPFFHREMGGEEAPQGTGDFLNYYACDAEACSGHVKSIELYLIRRGGFPGWGQSVLISPAPFT